jgi:hypothetical protein
MPSQVTTGAMMQCTLGAAPSSLVVLPTSMVLVEGPLGASIMDHIPMVNIMALCRFVWNLTVSDDHHDIRYVCKPMRQEVEQFMRSCGALKNRVMLQ